MEVSMAHLPGWVIVMDYIMGLIMWTLIGRVAMNIFLPLHSDFSSCGFSSNTRTLLSKYSTQ